MSVTLHLSTQERDEIVAALEKAWHKPIIRTLLKTLKGDVIYTKKFKKVYMAHPVAGDVGGNVARANNYRTMLKKKYELTHIVVAPWIEEVKIFDDGDPHQRERGLQKCCQEIATCDELWITGPRVSSGMRREIAFARSLGLRVMQVVFGPGGIELKEYPV